eukprot:6456714-Pyramimonas_sp.AAC.1
MAFLSLVRTEPIAGMYAVACATRRVARYPMSVSKLRMGKRSRMTGSHAVFSTGGDSWSFEPRVGRASLAYSMTVQVFRNSTVEQTNRFRCVGRWQSVNPTCPICRAPMDDFRRVVVHSQDDEFVGALEPTLSYVFYPGLDTGYYA